MILSNPADPIWTANLVPTTAVDTVAPEPALNDVVVKALNARPEVAQIRDNLRTVDVNLAYAKDQKLPQLDLNLGITETGFAGAVTPFSANPLDTTFASITNSVNALIARANATAPPGTTPLMPLPAFASTVPPYNVGGFSQAYTNMFAGRYPEYTISATLGFPLRNRTAEADYRAALEQQHQIAIQEVALVQRIQYESRNALQQYRSARSRLMAARAARIAAQEVSDSELRKFHAGASTTFLVLQRETDLATQRGRELQAQTDVAKALVELDRVSGAILNHYNVDASTLGKTPTVTTPLTK